MINRNILFFLSLIFVLLGAGCSKTNQPANQNVAMPVQMEESATPITESYNITTKEFKNEVKNSFVANVKYPEISHLINTTIQKKFNDKAKQIVMEMEGLWQDEEKNIVVQAGDEPSSFYGEYEVIGKTNDYVSIKFSYSEYETGAAHPNNFYDVLNFDLKKGETVALKDLFKNDSEYLQKLSVYCKKNLEDQSDNFNDMIEKGAAPDEENYIIFNFNSDGFLVTFGDYQVAPHAAGPVSILVPYDELKGVINPDGLLGEYIK